MRWTRVAILVGCLLLVPQAASAGGWWSFIQLDKDPMAIGEVVTARVEGAFATGWSSPDGEYHAYLLHGVDRDRLDAAMTTATPGNWWTAPEWRLHLAEVRVGAGSRGMAAAVARFVVPDVEPGRYSVMFCTAGCAEPLGDAIPRLDVTVHDETVQAPVLPVGAAARDDGESAADGWPWMVVAFVAGVAVAGLALPGVSPGRTAGRRSDGAAPSSAGRPGWGRP